MVKVKPVEARVPFSGWSTPSPSWILATRVQKRVEANGRTGKAGTLPRTILATTLRIGQGAVSDMIVCVLLIVAISDRSMEDLQEEVLTFLTCAKPGNWKKKTSKNTSFDIFILVSGFPTTWTTYPPSLPAPRTGEHSQIKYCSNIGITRDGSFVEDHPY